MGRSFRSKIPGLLILIIAVLIPLIFFMKQSTRQSVWIRHTIDDSSKGADGVKVGDLNHDGLPDFVTSWEQGGVVRIYLNPGPEKAKQKWKFVEIGKVESPEDSLPFDLNGDGS